MSIEKIEAVVNRDYELAHPDIEAAKRIEPFYEIFGLFRIKDEQVKTLVLAAARTIAYKLGIFTYFALDKELGYLSKPMRSKVINHLKNCGWIVDTAGYYEMPDRVGSFLTFLFSSVARGELTVSERMNLMIEESLYIEHFNLDDDEEKNVLRLSLKLQYYRDYMQQILQRKSHNETQKIMRESKEIRLAMDRAQNMATKKLSMTERTLVHQLCSEILAAVAEIIKIGFQTVNENARAIGEFVSPEMIGDFLRVATEDELTALTVKHFAAPKQSMQLREETVLDRGLNFLEHGPVPFEPSPTEFPEPVEYVEEEVVTEKVQNPMEKFYHELLVKMDGVNNIPLDKLLEKDDSFGMAIYRTGQSLKLAREVQESPEEREVFYINVGEEFKTIDHKNVAVISDVVIERKEKDVSDQRTRGLQPGGTAHLCHVPLRVGAKK